MILEKYAMVWKKQMCDDDNKLIRYIILETKTVWKHCIV